MRERKEERRKWAGGEGMEKGLKWVRKKEIRKKGTLKGGIKEEILGIGVKENGFESGKRVRK